MIQRYNSSNDDFMRREKKNLISISSQIYLFILVEQLLNLVIKTMSTDPANKFDENHPR